MHGGINLLCMAHPQLSNENTREINEDWTLKLKGRFIISFDILYLPTLNAAFYLSILLCTCSRNF